MIVKDFLNFIKEYNVVGLALAVIMGTASTKVVNSLVNDMIMPWITPLIPQDSWQQATLHLGPVALKWGSFTAEVLQFTILALVVFIVAKKILKMEKSPKK